uniref:Serpin domain-containing protein n=1 Tax=Denticeps clupeoides TaxID=299321 RepID=A0AAY4D1B3_9TELE
MTGILCRCVSACLLLSVAWASPQDGPDHHQHHLHHDKDQPHPKNGAENVLSSQNADFAFSLYNALNAIPENKDTNIFFSPLSISMALSMLAMGAKGDTHSQLYKALGFSELPPEKVNEGFEHIFHMLGHRRDNMELNANSAVAVDDSFKVLDKYLEDTKHFYESEAFTVDFSKPDIAAEEINKFIAEKTNNTITDMVKDLNPSTLMMLINCIYFKGEWASRFDKEETKKDNFLVNENKKVKVDMMQNTGTFGFYEDKENFTTVVRLPYKGNTSMIIVMPDEGKMNEVENEVHYKYVICVNLSNFCSYLSIHLPKFSTSGSYSLLDPLKAMGVEEAFTSKADFSGIAEASMHVAEVKHKAILKVDEEGTEAAGVTTVEFVRSIVPPQPKEVKINRPFLLFIADHITRSVLFMGKILDPTAD